MAPKKNSASTQQSPKEFICVYDDCEKKFSSLSHLNRHEGVHKNKTYKCDVCNEVFKAQYNWKRHVDNKHLKLNPKKYQCDYCDADFNKKSWLNQHVYKHTGIKPYKCTFENCEARFVVPCKLKRHMKIHEGYPCPKENCSEIFPKWTDVRRHLKIVHPKLYKCPECNQEFSRSNNLKSHLVTHSSNRLLFVCPLKGCDRFYSKKSNLVQHISSYHEKRPYKCPLSYCARAFKSQKDVDAHMSKHTLSGRLKKKKKKKKPKPSFAEELAGLAPKKWIADLLKSAPESTDVKPSLESSSDSICMKDNSEHPLENTTETQEIVLLRDVDENCNNVLSITSDEEMNNNHPKLNVNSVNDDDICEQNNDIQTLLNIIEERKDFETASVVQKTKDILLEA